MSYTYRYTSKPVATTPRHAKSLEAFQRIFSTRPSPPPPSSTFCCASVCLIWLAHLRLGNNNNIERTSTATVAEAEAAAAAATSDSPETQPETQNEPEARAVSFEWAHDGVRVGLATACRPNWKPLVPLCENFKNRLTKLAALGPFQHILGSLESGQCWGENLWECLWLKLLSDRKIRNLSFHFKILVF